MSQPEYERWKEKSLSEYMDENVKSGRWEARNARELAEKEFQQTLPQAIATRDHYLCTLQDAKTRKKVGSIWFQLRTDRSPPEVYLWDITVDEEYRRLGYGKAAMEELERRSRQLGGGSIRLNVFSHNLPAIRLYEKLGYATTNSFMSKKLQP